MAHVGDTCWKWNVKWIDIWEKVNFVSKSIKSNRGVFWRDVIQESTNVNNQEKSKYPKVEGTIYTWRISSDVSGDIEGR